MATITQKGKGKYQITVNITSGENRARKFKTVHTNLKGKEKRVFLNNAAAEFEKSVLEDANREKITFESLMNTWLSVCSSKWAPTTTERNRGITESYLFPVFGDRDVKSITSDEISLHYQSLVQTISASSVKRLNAVLSSFFSHLEKTGMIDRNPCRSVILPVSHSPEKKIKSLTLKQLLAFLDFADTPYHDKAGRLHKESPLIRTFIWTAAFSGCRRGELAALTWNDIDEQENSITINKSVYKITNKKEEMKTPKTPSSNRTIILPEMIFKRITELREPLSHGDDFVFSKGGARIGLNAFTCSFKRILKRYNETHSEKLPETLTLHSLRHTAASLLIESGHSVADVSKMLGHSLVSTTMDIYTHPGASRNMWDFLSEKI